MPRPYYLTLNHQISTYNASVPAQFQDVHDDEDLRINQGEGLMPGWRRLSLTGPCLFIRGQAHLQNQNLNSAIEDWTRSLAARRSEAVRVDANYWIGYLNPHFVRPAKPTF